MLSGAGETSPMPKGGVPIQKKADTVEVAVVGGGKTGGEEKGKAKATVVKNTDAKGKAVAKGKRNCIICSWKFHKQIKMCEFPVVKIFNFLVAYP